MRANPIDAETCKRVRSSNVDGSRHRRFSEDQARKRWYAASRSRRYGRYLASLS